MFFYFTISLLAERLLPIVFRSAFWVAWFRVLLAPLQTLNGVSGGVINRKLYDLYFNGQTVCMEWKLNNELGATGIFIANAVYSVSVPLVYPAVFGVGLPLVYPAPMGLVGMLVFLFADTPVNGANFTVNAPVALQSRELEIRYWTEKYKHGTYTYTIAYS